MREDRKRTVYLIGAGMGEENTMTGEAKAIADQADLMIGASRVIEAYQKQGKRCVSEYRTETIVKLILEEPEDNLIAVMFSGDTGFYSGAKKLYEALEEAGVNAVVLPGIGSVVCLAARVGTSWEDAALRSIHGRSQNVIYTIDRNEKTFLLMDAKHGEKLCHDLVYYGLGDVTCYIGQNLSYEDESVICKKGSELTVEDFGTLATVLVMNPDPNKRTTCHRKDEEFIRSMDGKVVPMTKEEVRAASIAKLDLRDDSVLYDVGAGTGSVSVEAALASEKIRVYAIERREDACALIEENKKKFRVDQVTVVQGLAPEAYGELEPPTHAFIGGSAGNLLDIIRSLKAKNSKVRIVINTVTVETIAEVMTAMKEGILNEPEIMQISASKAKKLGAYHLMTAQNPIYIITETNEDE